MIHERLAPQPFESIKVICLRFVSDLLSPHQNYFQQKLKRLILLYVAARSCCVSWRSGNYSHLPRDWAFNTPTKGTFSDGNHEFLLDRYLCSYLMFAAGLSFALCIMYGMRTLKWHREWRLAWEDRLVPRQSISLRWLVHRYTWAIKC